MTNSHCDQKIVSQGDINLSNFFFYICPSHNRTVCQLESLCVPMYLKVQRSALQLSLRCLANLSQSPQKIANSIHLAQATNTITISIKLVRKNSASGSLFEWE